MELSCRFRSVNYDTGESYYMCEVDNKTIPEDQELSFRGSLEGGRTNRNVTAIAFSNCIISKVPQGLTKTFPNLTFLDIHESNLKKVSRADLEEYKNFERFIFRKTDLEYLPGDLFQGFYNLQSFSLSFNKLKFIEPNFIDGLPKLRHANFNNNICINKIYTHAEQLPKATIESIKQELLRIFYSRFSFVQSNTEVKILKEQLESAESQLRILKMQTNVSEDKLNRDIEKLKESEQKLTKQVESLKESELQLSIEVQKLKKTKKILREDMEIQEREQSLLKIKILECKMSYDLEVQKVTDLKEANDKLKLEIQDSEASEAKLILEIIQLKGLLKYEEQQQKILNPVIKKYEAEIEKLKQSERLKSTINVEVLTKSEADLKQELEDLKISEKFSAKEVQRLRSSEEKLCREIQSLKISSNQNSKLDFEDIKPCLQDSICGDLKNLIQCDHFKDFTIIIDGTKFLVHKFLLAARSSTLAEIFKANPKAESLNLVDISTKTFEVILKFLYSDEIQSDDEVKFSQLYAAAGRLKIQKLQKIAGNKLADQIDPGNALEIFNLSHKNEDEELRQNAFDKIKKCYPLVDFKDEWITQPKRVAKCVKKFEDHIKKFQIHSDDSGDE